jgi:hypothetical protein
MGLCDRNDCAIVISVNETGLKVAKSSSQPRLATGGEVEGGLQTVAQ